MATMLHSTARETERRIAEYSDDAISKEAQIFSGSWEFVEEQDSPIAHECLSLLEGLQDGWSHSNVVIDTRVHMLQPGMFPAIPGWHLDAVPRNVKTGQPDLADANVETQHATLFLGPAPTRFLRAQLLVPETPHGANTYSVLHNQVEKLLASITLKDEAARPGYFTLFDSQGIHRAAAAEIPGWRYFFRATRGSHLRARNELRTQTQVYVSSLGAGW